MSNAAFKIAPVHAMHKNELYFHLYLHHNYKGDKPNQFPIADPNLPNLFGCAVVNDWPLYDGLGPDTKVVARAQGIHVQAGEVTTSWYSTFNIVFEDARFKGSTLQVMGPVVEEGEWAIVGGSGEFLLAQGIIYSKVHGETSGGNIYELDIHAFYAPPLLQGCTSIWTLGAHKS